MLPPPLPARPPPLAALSLSARPRDAPCVAGPTPAGYFYADILVGTPSQPFSVIVDTGSVSNYVPCASCGAACGPHHLNPPFDPAASNTSELVPCDSPLCVCSNVCGCSDAQCTYSVSYAEGSSSQGACGRARVLAQVVLCSAVQVAWESPPAHHRAFWAAAAAPACS